MEKSMSECQRFDRKRKNKRRNRQRQFYTEKNTKNQSPESVRRIKITKKEERKEKYQSVGKVSL